MEKDKRVDEGWKEQVERERQTSRQRGDVPPAGGASPEAGPAQPPRTGAPGARRGPAPSKGTDFGLFLSSLSMQALMALGEVPHPATGQPHTDLEQARYLIDILGMLQEKTRGNLSPEESAVLEDLLYELRMKYVAQTGGVS